MGSRMVWRRGRRRRAGLGQGCWRARSVPPVRLQGLLPGRVLQRFDEQIFDEDGVTVQKTEEVPKLPSRLGFVQFLDKVVDTPDVAQFFDKVADVPFVQVVGGVTGAVPAALDVPVDFRTFPRLGVGTAPRVEPIHAGGSAGGFLHGCSWRVDVVP